MFSSSGYVCLQGMVILNRYIRYGQVNNQKLNPVAPTQKLSLLAFIKDGARNSRCSLQIIWSLKEHRIKQFLHSISYQYALWYYNLVPSRLITEVLWTHLTRAAAVSAVLPLLCHTKRQLLPRLQQPNLISLQQGLVPLTQFSSALSNSNTR